jgi:hypothetical protein
MINGFIGGIGGLEIIFLLVPALVMFVLWLWAVVDIVRGNFTDPNQKIVWILIVIFIPFLGPILYFALGRSGRAQKN